MKRILSGIQPTGNLHLGNYLGALKRFVQLQHEAECYFCVVDLHALTVPRDPADLREKTMEVATLYLAAGLDPDKMTMFINPMSGPTPKLPGCWNASPGSESWTG